MKNNDDDEIVSLLKAFDNLANTTNIKTNNRTSNFKRLNSEDLQAHLGQEAQANKHKRWQRLFDFLADSVINIVKVLAFIIPYVLYLWIWAWANHNGYPDVAEKISIFVARCFDVFVGFLFANFLNTVFKKNS